jgi:hypothetical protein
MHNRKDGWLCTRHPVSTPLHNIPSIEPHTALTCASRVFRALNVIAHSIRISHNGLAISENTYQSYFTVIQGRFLPHQTAGAKRGQRWRSTSWLSSESEYMRKMLELYKLLAATITDVEFSFYLWDEISSHDHEAWNAARSLM